MYRRNPIKKSVECQVRDYLDKEERGEESDLLQTHVPYSMSEVLTPTSPGTRVRPWIRQQIQSD